VSSVEFFVLSRVIIVDMNLTFFITLALSSFFMVTEQRVGETKWYFLQLPQASS